MIRSANEFQCGILGFYFLDICFERRVPFQKTKNVFVFIGVWFFSIQIYLFINSFIFNQLILSVFV